MDKLRKSKLVHGYIRNQISFTNIPSDIIDLVDTFLGFADQWDAEHTYTDRFVINPKDNTITKCGKYTGTAYGKDVIDRLSGTQVWKLKITKYECSSHWFARIGIVKDDGNNGSFRSAGTYAFIAKGEIISITDKREERIDYGQPFMGGNDSMEMILDVKKGTMKFIINNIDYGFAYTNIDRTKRYRLAVTVSGLAKDTVIELS